MTFNDNARLDTSQVESGRSGGFGGGGGGIRIGGGIGGLILLIVMVIFGGQSILGGGDSTSTGGGLPGQQLQPNQVGAGGQVSDSSFSQCRTGADANKNDVCLIIATVNSVQDYWTNELPKYNVNYQPAKTVIYSGATPSACGTANSQVGPFYCPLDGKVYVDAAFFQELQNRFGADGGQLAKEYVIAHEYGHHIQDLLGLLGKAQQDPQGANSGSVRTELMADCLAGTWVKHATETRDADGNTLLQPITQSDIKSALSAASAVGDDRIQRAAQGRVTPETWTHGSSEARQHWFTQGYETGDLNKCDTFNVPNVE
ncbi:MAG: KPN_02809 family neutral zinc metallopeptidase [Intrasporangium sp.]|uniref:KPN_02809 family neutral zinc metallopeptidase n=1 Tax=Intrasporangium sp. TaxID=1925024 RepID=UPI003F81EEB4